MQAFQKVSMYIATGLEALWVILLLIAIGAGLLTTSLALFLVLLFLPLISVAIAAIGFFHESGKPILFVLLAGIVQFAMILVVAIVAASLSNLHLT